jgi:hypothetical protein
LNEGELVGYFLVVLLLYLIIQWLNLALSKGPSRVGVSLPSPEDGNRSSFRNAVFF